MARAWKPAISSRLVQNEIARRLDLAEESAESTDVTWRYDDIRSFVRGLRATLRLSKRFELRPIVGRHDIRELVPITKSRRGKR